MTSIYKQEDKHYIYQSEIPFPKREAYVNPESADWLQENYKWYFKESCDYWFKNAKRIVVKEGADEEKFMLYIFDMLKPNDFPQSALNGKEMLAQMKEGIEIPSSCYEIHAVPITFKEWGENKDDCQAVFVDSVPHAKGIPRLTDEECEAIGLHGTHCDASSFDMRLMEKGAKLARDWYDKALGYLPPPPNDRE